MPLFLCGHNINGRCVEECPVLCPGLALMFCAVHIFGLCAYYPRGDSINKKQKEQQNRQKHLNKLNSVTEKVKPENQNQVHNIRSENSGTEE